MNFKKPLAALGMAASLGLSTGAHATVIDLFGDFTKDNDVVKFTLTVVTPIIVKVASLGYAGCPVDTACEGLGGTGSPVVASGGFDTNLSLFAGSAGPANRDGGFLDGATAPGSNFSFLMGPTTLDSGFDAAFFDFHDGSGNLIAGVYTVALTQNPNTNPGTQNSTATITDLIDGFTYDGVANDNFTQTLGTCSPGFFCAGSALRTGHWHLRFDDGAGPDTATDPAEFSLTLQAAPEPLSVALFGIGLAGLAFARRRKTA